MFVFLEIQYQLVENTPEPSYGRVDVRMYYMWGEICGSGWHDPEADVFCRTLGRGFRGGVAMYYYKRPRMPTLVNEITCKGAETDFKQCVVGNYSECYTPHRAGAICFKDSGMFS